jgi:hypothetical protein
MPEGMRYKLSRQFYQRTHGAVLLIFAAPDLRLFAQ